MKIRSITAEETAKLDPKNTLEKPTKTTRKLLSNAENQQNSDNRRKRGRPKKVEVVEIIPAVTTLLENRRPVRVYNRQDIYRIEKQTSLHHTRDEVDDNWMYDIPVFTKKE